ncbi:MAG TPA: PAS domain-containing protein [Gemmatimonadaceae bacterium]|nr:PAS domain-containing protein [Gemmatimonadaceae bacterium]
MEAHVPGAELLDLLPAAVILADDRGVVTVVNRAWRLLAGEAGGALAAIAPGASLLAPPAEGTAEDGARSVTAAARALADGERDTVEVEYAAEVGGASRRFRLRGGLVGSGSRRCMLLFQEDITEHERGAAERRALARQVAAGRGLIGAVLQQMRAAVLVVEAPAGNLLLANEQAEAILRAPVQPLHGIADFDRFVGFHPDGRRLRSDEWPLARVLAEGAVIENERIELLRGDGTPAVIQCNAGPVRDAAGALIAGVVIFADVTEQSRAEDALRLLADAGALLAASGDGDTAETMLARVADLIVPRLADWCAIDIVLPVRGAGTREIRRAATRHRDSPRTRLLEQLHHRFPPPPDRAHGAPRVVRTGSAELHARVSDERLAALARGEEHLRMLREVGLRSVILAPLVGRGRRVGALTLVLTEPGRRFDQRDLLLAEELGRRVGIVLEIALGAAPAG